jgi:hypothetical protein
LFEDFGCEFCELGGSMIFMVFSIFVCSHPRLAAWKGPIAGVIGRAAVLAIACLGLFSQPAAASSIQRKSLSDLVKSAELVFEGTVVSSTVVPGPPERPPHTCVTFTITDVIAGADPGGTLVLCFMGGEVNGIHTVVTDLTYPAVGEHGIYLVESVHQRMVNPLIGWDQGHFLIEKDPVSGTEKVLTSHRRPVTALAAEAQGPTQHAELVPAEGTAAGVVSAAGPDIGQAMAPGDFKTWLRAAR